MRESDTLTAIVNETPFEDNELNLSHAVVTSTRSQCLLKDDEDLKQVSSVISERISECLSSPHEYSQFRVFESQSLTHQQVYHKDSTSTENLTCILALQEDGAVFSVEPGSHRQSDAVQYCARRAVQVRIDVGDMLVLYSCLTHAGGAYTSRNLRLHCYLFFEPPESRGFSDKRPNAENGRVNGEEDLEVRCSRTQICKGGRPGPVLAELLQTRDISSNSTPGETPLVQFTERMRTATTAWLPSYLVRPGVDGRTPAAIHARDVQRSIAESGFFPGKEVVVCADNSHEGARFLTVDGYHRALAMLSLGFQTIPVKIVPEHLSPWERLRMSRAAHTIDTCRRPVTVLDTLRSLYDISVQGKGRIRVQQQRLVLDLGFTDYRNARKELALARKLYFLVCNHDFGEAVCHKFFNLGTELSAVQLQTCMNVDSLTNIFKQHCQTATGTVHAIEHLEGILTKVASGRQAPAIIRPQHIPNEDGGDAVENMLDEHVDVEADVEKSSVGSGNSERDRVVAIDVAAPSNETSTRLLVQSCPAKRRRECDKEGDAVEYLPAEVVVPTRISPTSMRFDFDRCNGTECIATNALQTRTLIEVSGSYFVGASPSALDMPRSMTLENFSTMFAKPTSFVMKECCFTACNGNGAIVEPQREELQRSAGTLSGLWSAMAQLKYKIE
jgi:hypothetical protein